MFIEEKYLIGPNSNGVEGSQDDSITILVCKYCKREFMVPNIIADNLIVNDVCESSDCKNAYERAIAESKVAEIKNDTSNVNDLKKAIAD